jgi:hypothetical protein
MQKKTSDPPKSHPAKISVIKTLMKMSLIPQNLKKQKEIIHLPFAIQEIKIIFLSNVQIVSLIAKKLKIFSNKTNS